MVEVQHDSRDADPITQSFVVDRQKFWGRFTGFTTYAATVIVILLCLMWFFLV